MQSVFRSSILSVTLAGGIGVSGILHAQVSSQTRPTATQVALERKLIEGEKYTFLGDWEKAEPIFRSILEEDVQNSAACYQLSRTLLATGKAADALTYIRKAERIEPDNEWYLLMESDIHEKIGDLLSTVDVYERLLQLRPKKPQYYEMMVSLCKRTSQPERLLRTLDQYEALVGVSESITRNRFETLDGLGRTDEAMEAIRRLTVVFPLNIEYKYLAASYAKKTGREDIALGYYKQILDLDPDDPRAKLALAGAEKKEGDKASYLQSIMPVISNPSIELDIKLEELIPYVLEYAKTKDPGLGSALQEVIQQLVNAHPREAKVYAIQGDILSQAGKDAQAIASYKQATTLKDNVYAVWEQLIALLLSQREYDELLVQAGKAIDIFPNQGYLYYASGFAYYKKKQLADARDMLNQALIMTGKNTGQKINVLNLLGMVHDELGDVDKSVTAFESSLSINPRHPETLAYYALSLSRRIVHSDGAIEMADQVMKEGPKSGWIQQILAETYYNQQQYDKANLSMQYALDQGTDGAGYNLSGDILIKLGKKEEALAMWQKAIDKGYMTSIVQRKMEEYKTQ